MYLGTITPFVAGVSALLLANSAHAENVDVNVLEADGVSAFIFEMPLSDKGLGQSTPFNLYADRSGRGVGLSSRSAFVTETEEPIYWCQEPDDPDTCVCIANCGGGILGPLDTMPEDFVSLPEGLNSLGDLTTQHSDTPLFRTRFSDGQVEKLGIGLPDFLFDASGQMAGIAASQSGIWEGEDDDCFCWCRDPNDPDSCAYVNCGGGGGGPLIDNDVIRINVTPKPSVAENRMDYQVELHRQSLEADVLFRGFTLRDDGTPVFE